MGVECVSFGSVFKLPVFELRVTIPLVVSPG